MKKILIVPNNVPCERTVFAESLRSSSYEESQRAHQTLFWGCPPYLLPHVDEEELPGHIEGHVGIIGIVPEVGDGDV